jgi:DNA-binding response OmpR family regulator
MAKVLVVEDEKDIADVVCEILQRERHTVETVGNGREAFELLRVASFDLIILDWNLPGLTGLEVCREYRQVSGKTPMLFLTGKSAVKDKVAALNIGADDYLTKPFAADELSARVHALLRRPQSMISHVLQVGDLTLDSQSFEVKRAGRLIELVPKEFALLEFLMKHSGQVFRAEALVERVWPSESEASPDTIRTYIKTLRRKVDGQGMPPLIATVYGVGYKVQAPEAQAQDE